MLVSIFKVANDKLPSLFCALKFSICKFSLCIGFSNVPVKFATSDAIPFFIPNSTGHRCLSSTLFIKSSISRFLSILPFAMIGALLTYPTALTIFITLFEKSISALILFISSPFALTTALLTFKKPADLILFKSPLILKSAFKVPSSDFISLNFEKSASILTF